MKRSILLTLSMAALVFLTAKVQADGGECANNFTTTSLPAPSSLHVGVILVQFSDWATNLDAKGGRALFFTGTDSLYTHQDFYRHLFSQNSYSTADPDDPNSTPRTHDNEAIFGSMRDFYDENSYGKFTLTGQILNDTTAAGIPIWVTLSKSKAWWRNVSSQSGGAVSTILDSTLAACQRDSNCTINTTGFDKIVIMYAGNEESGNALNPAAPFVGADVYQVGEKNVEERGRTQTIGTFYGIGTHVHEFGHMLGLRDFRNTNDPDHPRGISEFALMAAGNQGFMDGSHANTSKRGGSRTHSPQWLEQTQSWLGQL